MSIGKIENTIYGPHLVNPDRVVIPSQHPRKVVPGPKPFDAPPGVVPFHRFLKAENLAHRDPDPATCPAACPEHCEKSAKPCPIKRPRDTVELGDSARLLPKLGEVLPVQKIRPAPIEIEQTRQIAAPATGRLLDLYT